MIAELLKEGIYRVCIPFENIYTSSFILTEKNDAIILDSGSNDEDAEKYIIPALKELGFNVKYIVSSHTHGDHNGGIDALRKAYPNAQHLYFADDSAKNNEMLFSRYRILNLKGHSDDSLAVLDTKSNTLLSCDCLQLRGVGRYGTSVSDFNEYYKSIEYVRNLNVKSIIASHNYVPMGAVAENGGVLKYLDACKDIADEILKFVYEHRDTNNIEMEKIFNNKCVKLPPVGSHTFSAGIRYKS